MTSRCYQKLGFIDIDKWRCYLSIRILITLLGPFLIWKAISANKWHFRFEVKAFSFKEKYVFSAFPLKENDAHFQE